MTTTAQVGQLLMFFFKRPLPLAPPQAPPKHPAEQLQKFMNLLGEEGWEMTTTAQVGQLLMFFFKRPLPLAPSETTSDETATGQN